MELSGKKVLVFGTGVSGIAAAKLLRRMDAQVVLFDGNAKLEKEKILARFRDDEDISLYLGELPARTAAKLDLLILSPGVPTDLPLVSTLRGGGIPVWGEVELAYRCERGSVLAITGTNGKTTTSTLLYEIIKRARGEAMLAGNIGTPYTEVVSESFTDSVTVLEISSFQLETTESFAPYASAILNITPDHLNRHHNMENYVAAKLKIAQNQEADSVCVLNYDDPILRGESARIGAEVCWFSSRTRLDKGMWMRDDVIIYSDGEREIELISVGELNIPGRHNYENVMAASAMAIRCGADIEIVREVLREFRAVEHRIEYVTEKRGVRFYNDSKATNTDAAIHGIEAMDRPTCLIGGGYDKEAEYGEWIRSFGGRVKLLVLIGQTREKIAAAAEECGFFDYVFADDLRQAVDICYEKAKRGDAVLLSPACASWGMFENYEERGRSFKELAHALDE